MKSLKSEGCCTQGTFLTRASLTATCASVLDDEDLEASGSSLSVQYICFPADISMLIHWMLSWTPAPCHVYVGHVTFLKSKKFWIQKHIWSQGFSEQITDL